MSDADARTQTAQYPGVATIISAARELQKVLPLSLPSFYRCALRLLRNRADAEDAGRKHSWLLTNICTNSGDSSRCPLG
jgi:hypothetical protein